MPNHDLVRNEGDVNMRDWEDYLDAEGDLIMDLDDEQVYAGEMELNEDFEASDDEEAKRQMELAEELERDKLRATQMKEKREHERLLEQLKGELGCLELGWILRSKHSNSQFMKRRGAGVIDDEPKKDDEQDTNIRILQGDVNYLNMRAVHWWAEAIGFQVNVWAFGG